MAGFAHRSCVTAAVRADSDLQSVLTSESNLLFLPQAGAFRIGDTAGTLDNIAACKLHRPGSVGFVSKSGGMSNEMYNVLARTTDGLYEGIAIGGDVFPGSTLSDHCLRYENIPQIKLIVVLGELGGTDEYSLVRGAAC